MQTINTLAINGSNPVVVGGTGTAEKIFPFVPGASIGVASTKDGILTVPGNLRASGLLVKAVATGNFEVGSGGACPNVTIRLLANTAAFGATPSYTALATSGAIVAQNLTGVFYPWNFEFNLFGDNDSGIVNGRGIFLVDNTSVVKTTLDSSLSGINFATDPAYGLAVGVTFSVSEAGNKAKMFQFELQA